MRVRFDAALLHRLAEAAAPPDPATLDTALLRLGLLPPAKGGRPLAERARGARRLLFRQAARQLVGLLPVIGLVPKVAVAYGGTWAIGRAVVLWATGGGAVTRARLRELSREGLARGREVARSFRRAGDI
jgi:hypothetical protein